MNLTDKHRPTTLAEVLGQPDAVERLQTFLRAPYPSAWLFHGPTGTGKSCTALALAQGLGIPVDKAEIGGLWQIASGEQTAESVRKAVANLRTRPWEGSGWRMLLVNEADRLTDQAAFVWLDVLEPSEIPPSSVIVFTTNSLAKLSQRFRDRCEPIEFAGRELDQALAVQELIAKVWKAELDRDDWPYPEEIGLAADKDGNVSFRRVLQTLAPIIRNGGTLPPAALVLPPVARLTTPLARPARPAEDDAVLVPKSAIGWLVGGALLVLVGALAVLSCVAAPEENRRNGRGFRVDDLLQ